MKKLLVLLIIFISSHQAFAQFSKFESCKEAEQQAIEDVENGMYKWRIHGLVDIEFSDFRKFYEIYMYSKYNIEITYEGCLVEDKEICYTKKMVNLIEANYGPEFIEKKETELTSIFPTLSEQDKAEILDLDKTYNSNLESGAKFMGNDHTVRTYIKSIIDFNITPNTIYEYVELTIDEEGRVTHINIRDHLKFKDENMYQTYINDLNELGNWMPGFIYNTKVKSTANIHISL